MRGALAGAASEGGALAHAGPGGASAQAARRARWESVVAEAEGDLERTLERVKTKLVGAQEIERRLALETASQVWVRASERMRDEEVEHEVLRAALARLHEESATAVRANPRTGAIGRAAARLERTLERTHGERARWWAARAGTIPALAGIAEGRWQAAAREPAWATGMALLRWGARRVDAAAETLLVEGWGKAARSAQHTVAVPSETRVRATLEHWPFDKATPPIASVYACALEGMCPQGDREWAAAIEIDGRIAEQWGMGGGCRRALEERAGSVIEGLESALLEKAQERWRELGGDREGLEEAGRRWRADAVLRQEGVRTPHLEDTGWKGGGIRWRVPYTSAARVIAGAEAAREVAAVAARLEDGEGAHYAVQPLEGRAPRARSEAPRADTARGRALAHALERVLRDALGMDPR